MASTEPATVLSLAFRKLSDALHQASVACKDLEYTLPLLAAKRDTSAAKTIAQAPAEKTKRIRDPNEPRRPPSSYLVFLSKAREDLTKTNPELKPAEVMSKLASMWKDLSESQKQPYEAEAERLKEGYERERDQYEKDHPDLARKRKRVNPPKPEAKALPSPTTVTPAIESRLPPETPSAATKASEKDGKQASKKDRSPKSERKKEKEKEKEPEKDKRKRRKSEAKSK